MSARRLLGLALLLTLLIVAALILVPGFAMLLGRAIANLWVTVMSAVAGILGGFFGA